MSKFEMVKAVRMNLEVRASKTQKEPIAYFTKFKFSEMIHWVYRNCQGCESILIIPRQYIEVKFEDRTEIYTLEKTEVPDYFISGEAVGAPEEI